MSGNLQKVLLSVFLALGIGVSSLFLIGRYINCPRLPRVILDTVLMRKASPGPATKYMLAMAATARGPRGTLVDEYFYCSSNCFKVVSEFYSFDSAEVAQQEMKAMLNNCRVVEHAATDDPGLERVVAFGDPKNEYFILRRRDQRIQKIASSSLLEVLEFERRIKPQTEKLSPAVLR